MKTVYALAPCKHDGWLHDTCWFYGACGYAVDKRGHVSEPGSSRVYF